MSDDGDADWKLEQDPENDHMLNPKFQRKNDPLLESSPDLQNHAILVSAIKKKLRNNIF